MGQTVATIRHVHFEDLGTLEAFLQEAGYQIRYYESGVDELPDPVTGAALAVVLGGPVGVCETEAYPEMASERLWLKTRMEACRPTVGICLGAQLMAAALGSEVGPMGRKEIGFAPLELTEAGRRGPLRHLEGIAALHWHGDSFAIPAGAEHLAATNLCRNQAFALGPRMLGLQFHVEVDGGSGFERWLLGHAVELAGAGIDPHELRRQAAFWTEQLRRAAQAMFAEWLSGIADC
ncbi:MAG TPA: glutamine amidotransferase [Edaphobacter sp.]|uniref:glutamine amidotransferase n=1 Tax=Edaphobacter sp. TaxID=1934404 RepID=UPI002C960886|nr:glutamine amidotransferase [Edaphobacter sp.]HUZ95390.1 glutamine amidotransferase [Edaphobacter sp.]